MQRATRRTVIAGYDDGAAFAVLTMSLLAAQYLRMRSDIARRCAGVSRRVFVLCMIAGSFGFGAWVTPACRGGTPRSAERDRFDATSPGEGSVGGLAGAISMPNIAERSSLASTFAPTGRLPLREIGARVGHQVLLIDLAGSVKSSSG